MKTIGFFGGSFNPPHLGHIALADAIAASGMVDEVWLVLSPLNPLKSGDTDLASDTDRLAMLRLAVEGHPSLRVCDVELSMPRPSYTVDTLSRLSEEYPDSRFRLIVGEDNWRVFDRWRDAATLRGRYAPIVYRRGGNDAPVLGADTLQDAPLLPMSGTAIRRLLAEGGDVNNMVDEKVYRYILAHRLYGVEGG